MGNGYEKAFPPCSFFKNQIMHKILLPIAEQHYQETLEWIRKNNPEELDKNYHIGLRGKSAFWKGYLIEKIVRIPDEKCTDPLTKNINKVSSFSMIIVMEGNPQVFPMERLDTFIRYCINIAYDIMHPGVNDTLKIEIPNEFFDELED